MSLSLSPLSCPGVGVSVSRTCLSVVHLKPHLTLQSVLCVLNQNSDSNKMVEKWDFIDELIHEEQHILLSGTTPPSWHLSRSIWFVERCGCSATTESRCALASVLLSAARRHNDVSVWLIIRNRRTATSLAPVVGVLSKSTATVMIIH